MPRLRFFLLVLVLLASPASVPGDEPKKDGPRHDPAALARRLWMVIDAVREHHVEPPTRSAMLLAAVKALANPDDGVPDGLGRRLAALKTPEELAALLRELWPAEDAAAAELEEAVLTALLKEVPGGVLRMAPHEARAAEQVAGNRYVGTGIQISQPKDEKFAQIRVPFPRGPAHRAGALVGDLILEVDGVNLEGAPLRKVVEVLRGEEGTPCTMVVRQPNTAETRTLKMIRGIVPFETVLGYRRLAEDRWEFRPQADVPVGYVRVGAISSSTLHELRQIEAKLRAEGVRGLVVDLRFNSGGTVHNAALLADAFLDGGLLWRTRDAKKKEREYVADRECLFRDWPVAVLVHDLMPPGAIWVAAALQDNGRVVLVGDPKSGAHAAYTKEPVSLGKDRGTLVLRTGTVERGKAGDWTLRPDVPVGLSAAELKGLQGWYLQQELPQGKSGERPPQDPQLDRALEVVQSRLEKQAAGG